MKEYAVITDEGYHQSVKVFDKGEEIGENFRNAEKFFNEERFYMQVHKRYLVEIIKKVENE